MRAAAGLADRDEPLAEDELGVLDAAALALDLEAELEAEGAAEEVDGGGGVVVEHAAGHAGPAVGGLLHPSSPVSMCDCALLTWFHIARTTCQGTRRAGWGARGGAAPLPST